MKRGIFIIGFFVFLAASVSAGVEYYHSADAGNSTLDCFDGTCLTMNLNGPVYNFSGSQQWGCGKCGEVSFWSDNLKGMHPDCVSGMKNIPGVDLCFVADNGNEWDIVFSIWSSARSSEFEYTRNQVEDSDDEGEGDRRRSSRRSENDDDELMAYYERLIAEERALEEKSDVEVLDGSQIVTGDVINGTNSNDGVFVALVILGVVLIAAILGLFLIKWRK